MSTPYPSVNSGSAGGILASRELIGANLFLAGVFAGRNCRVLIDRRMVIV